MRSTLRLISFLTLAASALTACGSEATPPAESPTVEAPAQEAAPADDGKKPGDNPSQSQINIDERIKKACGLTDTEAHFAYNSANIRESDKAILKKIADCFTTGPLKGQTMLIVGHADPRGEPEYNVVLGGRRADNVGSAMMRAGLPEAQLQSSSRGELDATGTDEASWSAHRRVDILLAEDE